MTARRSTPPLRGLRVVVTRARHQAASTVGAFEGAGARVELLPLIEVVPPRDRTALDAALARLADDDGFDWILFTSSNAVDQVFDRLSRLGAGASTPSLAGTRTAVVGGATADALRARGMAPDLEAVDSRAEGLADLLRPLVRDERVLLPQAADARSVLEDLLRRAGADVTRVAAYAKRRPRDSRSRADEIFGTSRCGWVTFTSPSIAKNFATLWDDDWQRRREGLLAVSIGPVTSAALRELGVEPAAEAESPGDPELVEAVIDAVAGVSS